MLYPEEDHHERCLYMRCKHCGDRTPAQTKRVYRNEIKRSADQTVTPKRAVRDLPKDPALPQSNAKQCPECGAFDAVYFTASGAAREQSMCLYFVCGKCAHMWKDEHEDKGDDDDETRAAVIEEFNAHEEMN